MEDQDIGRMSNADLVQWIHTLPDFDEIDREIAIECIKREKISGKDFQSCTKQDWLSVKLPLGIATLFIRLQKQNINIQISDVSYEIYRELTQPFAHEPSLDQLRNILSSDPVVKLPLNPFQINMIRNFISNELFEKLFRCSVDERFDLSHIIEELAIMPLELDSSGVFSLHYYVDLFMKRLLKRFLFGKGG
jgi:hypothetical protein